MLKRFTQTKRYMNCRPTNISIPLYFAYSILLLFTSCRKLVQDEFPDFPAYPVVNSILVADSTIKVHVSLTNKLDTIQLGWVDSAEVLLYVDRQYQENLSYKGEGIYTSNTVADAGKTYSCEVSIPGFPVARCTDSIPDPTTISDIVHINNAGMNDEGLAYPSITFTMANNLQRKEYFEAIINLTKYGGSLIYIEDPILLNEGLPIAVFSDELMDEDQYTMTFNYMTGHAGSTDGEPYHMKLSPLILEIRCISYDFYQYVKQLYLYETGRYPDIVGGVVTPFPLHSNVENGYGIFAGYSAIVSDTIFPESLLNEYNYEGK